MEQNLTILALIQLVLSIIIGIFFLWLTYKLFLFRFEKKYELKEINVAFAFLLAAVLYSTGYILSGTLTPLLNTLRIINRNNPTIQNLLLETFRYVSEFLVIGFVVALLVNYISMRLFNVFTPDKNELVEISKNQLQFSLILAAIILVMSLFAREAYVALLDSLVPYPIMPKIF